MVPGRIKRVVDKMYEVAESTLYPDHWHVEAVGEDGQVYVAVFSGPEAAKRAAEYAEWKNSAAHSATPLHLVK